MGRGRPRLNLAQLGRDLGEKDIASLGVDNQLAPRPVGDEASVPIPLAFDPQRHDGSVAGMPRRGPLPGIFRASGKGAAFHPWLASLRPEGV